MNWYKKTNSDMVNIREVLNRPFDRSKKPKKVRNESFVDIAKGDSVKLINPKTGKMIVGKYMGKHPNAADVVVVHEDDRGQDGQGH